MQADKKNFAFVGEVPASKSLFNRALVVKSFDPSVGIKGRSQAKDVVLMSKAVEQILNRSSNEFDCGLSATMFRFLSIRLSRMEGEFFLKGEPELLRRPHDQLNRLLLQLSCDFTWKENGLLLRSKGWRPQGDGIHLSMQESSQFASALVLSAWDLDFPLFLVLDRKPVSAGYFKMTLETLRYFGMKLDPWSGDVRIPSHQKVLAKDFQVEADVSCAFALATLAAINGMVHIRHFKDRSSQPDSQGFIFLKRMGVFMELKDNNLKIRQGGPYRGIDANLRNMPDLFPVLASFCALAEGESHLFGAHHLRFKESNRIQKTFELLNLLGAKVKELPDGLHITGPLQFSEKTIQFDCNKDHRLAMAAGLLMKAGAKIDLVGRECVDKSFPEYWKIWRGGV